MELVNREQVLFQVSLRMSQNKPTHLNYSFKCTINTLLFSRRYIILPPNTSIMQLWKSFYTIFDANWKYIFGIINYPLQWQLIIQCVKNGDLLLFQEFLMRANIPFLVLRQKLVISVGFWRLLGTQHFLKPFQKSRYTFHSPDLPFGHSSNWINRLQRRYLAALVNSG